MPIEIATLPNSKLTSELIERMQKRAGMTLNIEPSTNNEEATRIAVKKFAGGIGDVNPLWTDPEHARQSPYGALVAPPSFVLACFSGLQFGWPGMGSFHSMTRLEFRDPTYVGEAVRASCVYEGFSGPVPSRFAGDMVTDRFTNRYRNDAGVELALSRWEVVNFERSAAQDSNRKKSATGGEPLLPHPWTAEELARIDMQVMSESPRGAEPRFWEDVAAGDVVDRLTKGPIGLTDEIAFIVGGGTPIPRLAAHAVSLQQYHQQPAWAFRDPVTHAHEPIYAVHYNQSAARAMGVSYPYDVGFQRQAWQVHHLTHWCGDHGWIKSCEARYRRFVYLSDVIELSGTITGKRIDEDGEYVVDIETRAMNQRDEDTMPGKAVIALPSRASSEAGPAARRARKPK